MFSEKAGKISERIIKETFGNLLLEIKFNKFAFEFGGFNKTSRIYFRVIKDPEKPFPNSYFEDYRLKDNENIEEKIKECNYKIISKFKDILNSNPLIEVEINFKELNYEPLLIKFFIDKVTFSDNFKTENKIIEILQENIKCLYNEMLETKYKTMFKEILMKKITRKINSLIDVSVILETDH